MLRFFRQIRQRLITDNKFSKYLLYAVGEILLVVIGILIAFQVDNWNEEKNEQLRAQRGITFEEILFHIEHGDLLDVLEHPNPKRYPGQRILVVGVNDYAYLVPYVEDDRELFLKTIIPSRKATKQYMGE